MRPRDEAAEPDCARARAAIHRQLDGEPLEPASSLHLAGHLSSCASCREAHAELRLIQQGLHALPGPELPAEVLERVWERTSRAGRTAPRRGWLDWRIAAAAVLAVAAVALWQWQRRPEISEAELARAAAESRLVLALAGQALHRAEQVAVRQVLAEEVSGTLRRVPIRWSEAPPAERRRPAS